jgi:uncharacterized protein (TIGR00251 family)
LRSRANAEVGRFDRRRAGRSARVANRRRAGERLRVAVTSPPLDGAANAAVSDALADAFGVRRSAVEIVRGERGRRKTVRIAGGTRAVLARLLESGGSDG